MVYSHILSACSIEYIKEGKQTAIFGNLNKNNCLNYDLSGSNIDITKIRYGWIQDAVLFKVLQFYFMLVIIVALRSKLEKLIYHFHQSKLCEELS